jgi:hypothetical protein
MWIASALSGQWGLTRQALAHDTKVAQEYYEKVKHLGSIISMVTNFESQLLFDLDVD